MTKLQDEEIRELHAKMILLKSEQWYVLLAGSSNFTAAGLGVNPQVANLEANLMFRVKASDNKARAMNSIWPKVSDEELDLDSTDLIWDPEPEELEGGADVPPLPASFREAIFIPGEKPRLMITLSDGLPEKWNVRAPYGANLLGSEMGHGSGEYDLMWTEQSPPFVLEVSWRTQTGTAAANWPVNVSNPAALPAPDELTGLSLEELLAVLSSTRPLHDAVARVLKRRLSKPQTGIELDPLRRYDSQATLLRRSKRVAIALDRLRERLERPALTRDAFEWRLRGTIGPVMLADAFLREATLPGEAKFYLAELALTISRVRPTLPAAGGLSVGTITQLISALVSELEVRASTVASPVETRALDQYIGAAFFEAKRE
ncbi:MAG: hypothetical protein M3O61_07120 [Gemmatimonadota bacterium]|nr:hypothetical protein [Gemmatimonadota bacterium]